MLVCVVIAIPLLWVLFWRAKVNRQAFRDFYLDPGSWWHGWIRGGAWMFTTRALVAYAMALLLIIGLARVGHQTFWVAIIITAFAWTFTYSVLLRHVMKHTNNRFHRFVATRLHSYAWFSSLLVVLCVLAFWEPIPDVRGLTLDEAVIRFTFGCQVESQILEWGLVVTEALRAIPHWLMQNFEQVLPGKMLASLAWFLVLLRELMFAWPLMLLFQAVQDLLDGGMIDRLREAGYELS